ncbi:HYR domain-containing protein [Paracrocinitomix mangrovi]|uniref:HYR domain-containing protein n=1 Tax=Paracrocinitomix mangrovi TaxID=2862509 RepID=UPI003AB943ED
MSGGYYFYDGWSGFGYCFPCGYTTVTYQVVDASGNTTSCSFDVLLMIMNYGYFLSTITLLKIMILECVVELFLMLFRLELTMSFSDYYFNCWSGFWYFISLLVLLCYL